MKSFFEFLELNKFYTFRLMCLEKRQGGFKNIKENLPTNAFRSTMDKPFFLRRSAVGTEGTGGSIIPSPQKI